jgi:RNA polymerase sigma-70 factor (sigma-E family)
MFLNRRPAAGAAVVRTARSLLAARASRVPRALASSSQHGTPGSDADQAMTMLYDRHYRALTQLAGLLVSDVDVAEEIVQEAFVAMHSAWRRLRGCDRALPYLRQAVIRRSRSECATRTARPGGQQGAPAAGQQSAAPGQQTAGQQPVSAQQAPGLVAALRALPARQREALILRYYADMPDAQIATAMGISIRTVSSHVARGISSLRVPLERG